MFKRIEKKQKRQAEIDELGLDENAKEMLGIQDTDSDESESESDASASEDEMGPNVAEGDVSMMTTEWLDTGNSGSEDEEDSDTEEPDFDPPPMTLAEAIVNPIYAFSEDVTQCITCPNKKLKNDKMVEAHLQSTAHKRRFQKFCELADTQESSSEDPRRVTALLSEGTTKDLSSNDSSMSKRALKRKQKLDSIKKKREMIKEIVSRKRSRKERENQKSDRPSKKTKVSKELSPEETTTNNTKTDSSSNIDESRTTPISRPKKTTKKEKSVDNTKEEPKKDQTQDGVVTEKSEEDRKLIIDVTKKSKKKLKPQGTRFVGPMKTRIISKWRKNKKLKNERTNSNHWLKSSKLFETWNPSVINLKF
ncbi:hypothetical protein PNOK_0784900 [Pyrrhoderma noxium]|uniref:Uncharacterized protein n=1 Tax=Pyrrhoderma noxium TaxID=2282107 RepID=A0A286U9J7_9AGAM|nr:hypothetical protein PNOK_0784900 [Pyrrhoderma noxium]